MTDNNTRDMNINDVMAQVGFVLLNWSWVETQLDAEISFLVSQINEGDEPKSKSFKISSRIEDWKDFHGRVSVKCDKRASHVEKLAKVLTDALQVRNALCHGMNAVSGASSISKAFVKTKLSDKMVKYSFSDLEKTIQDLDKSRLALQLLSHMTLNTTPKVYDVEYQRTLNERLCSILD